jgi:hypothetical protein
MNRIEECIKIMKQIRDLGIPTDYPPLKELSNKMSDYIKTGDPWSGKIKFEAYGRVAEVILPRRKDIEISVILRKLS